MHYPDLLPAGMPRFDFLLFLMAGVPLGSLPLFGETVTAGDLTLLGEGLPLLPLLNLENLLSFFRALPCTSGTSLSA